MKKALLRIIKFIVDWVMDRNMEPAKTIKFNKMPSREYVVFKPIQVPCRDYSHLIRKQTKLEPQVELSESEIRRWKENNRLVADYFNRRYAIAN